MKNLQITHWCHEIIRSQAKAGGHYIDATMGKGQRYGVSLSACGRKGECARFRYSEGSIGNDRKKSWRKRDWQTEQS